MYEFICGNVPFGDGNENPYEVYNAIVSQDVSFPKFIKDKEFMDLIEKLLKKNPVDRLSNPNSILAHPWFSSFNADKLLSMRYKPPYIPKLKNNIRLKTLSYEEFLTKSASSDYIPLDEGKFDEEEIWFKEFERSK